MERQEIKDTAGRFVFEKHGSAHVMTDAPAYFAACRFPLPSGAAGLDQIGDWGGQRKPKTKDRILSALRAADRSYELVYDAAHGRRYRLAVWPAFSDPAMAQAARRAAIAAANELGATLAYEMEQSA
jgi:hypothetical protein